VWFYEPPVTLACTPGLHAGQAFLPGPALIDDLIFMR
jgi:hypothetical protein